MTNLLFFVLVLDLDISSSEWMVPIATLNIFLQVFSFCNFNQPSIMLKCITYFIFILFDVLEMFFVVVHAPFEAVMGKSIFSSDFAFTIGARCSANSALSNPVMFHFFPSIEPSSWLTIFNALSHSTLPDHAPFPMLYAIFEQESSFALFTIDFKLISHL